MAYLKQRLPYGLKQAIKRFTGLGLQSAAGQTLARVDLVAGRINIAIKTGGGLGDFIVYLAIIDQLLAKYACDIHIFTFSYENARTILGERKNVFIHYPLALRPNQFDLIMGLDHYVHVEQYRARRLASKDKKLYEAVQKIINWNRENIPAADMIIVQRNVIIFRAKYSGLNRWTQLSCGGVFDMLPMHSDIGLDTMCDNFLAENSLDDCEYITISCGADPDAGGQKQTKVWPPHRYEEFVRLFKGEYPSIKVVQLSTAEEPIINGTDIQIRNAALGAVKIFLKHALLHLANEGGMAHIATQLGTKCVVLFGPTPVHYYGYPQNVNIVSPLCSGCMEYAENWFVRCARGLETAECMEGITGDMVMGGAREILK